MTGTQDGEEAVSPAAVLRGTVPPDDAGAETFDRYEWQAAMATADVLAAYLDHLDDDGALRPGATFEMICEHHEDWALSDGHSSEIVSCKHKETEVGAFTTIRSLLVDGGVLHLLDRWLALGRTPSCRLVTTAGVANEVRDLIRTAEAFAAGTPDGETYDAIMEKIVRAVAHARTAAAGTRGGKGVVDARSEDRATLAAFLRVLRVQDSKPARGYVALLAPPAYARPVAARVRAARAEDAIWMAVLSLIRERMRAAGPRRRGHLPTILGARNEPGYEARTITLDDVAVAIRVAIDNQAGFRPLPRHIRTSKVAIKMTTGGCSDNAVERAEALRRQYRQHWREIQAIPSMDPAQRRVENILLRVLDEATDAVRIPGQKWGRELWWEVQTRLDKMADEDRAYGLDADLLLGGVSDLSNKCRAWFSDAFDVEAEELRLLREAAGATVVTETAGAVDCGVGGPEDCLGGTETDASGSGNELG